MEKKEVNHIAWKWSVAIFAARENYETLASTIKATLDATIAHPTVIDVVINGNIELSDKAAQLARSFRLEREWPTLMRMWHVEMGDKSHAWNKYVHVIWPGSEIAFFVDGYARVYPRSFTAIDRGLEREADALGATGVPTFGRSAEALRTAMLSEGGIHGNLYALRGAIMDEFRKRDFRLPLGLYRTDPTIAAAICYRLDPANNEWESTRILVEPEAMWAFQPLAWWRPKDIITHVKRYLRQAQGKLESAAVREHLSLQKKSPESLPRTVTELVQTWIDTYPASANSLFLRNPLCYYVARRLGSSSSWANTSAAPELITEISSLSEN